MTVFSNRTLILTDCGPLPKIDFGYLTSNIYNNIQGAEAMLKCFDGYVVSGNRNVKCENNAGVLGWNTKMTACVPICMLEQKTVLA